MTALKILMRFRDLAADPESRVHYSILNPIVLMQVKAHPGCSKADLVEFVYGARNATKSGLDPVVKVLIAEGLIKADINQKPSTKAGDGKIYYSITSKGNELLKLP